MRLPSALILAAASVIALGVVPTIAPAQPATATSCAPGVKLQYVCGVTNPEDLVQVPGSDWIIASGLADAKVAGSGGLTLVDAQHHTAAKVALTPAGKPLAAFAACPGPLDPARFSAHGLSIRPLGRGKSRLLVVGHGAREAIEVFDIAATKGAPTVTWVGCIPEAAGSSMNSVVGLADGRVIATDFYHAPLTMQDALAGKNTGAVYAWKPGGAFTKLPGTELPGPNGIEVTPDYRYLFVAVTGTSSVMRYELAATEKPPVATKTDFRTDNLRWGPDGKLLLAGPGQDPNCKPGAGVRCLGTPVVGALDPISLNLTTVFRGPPETAFQGLSSALIVGKTLWLGSYQADRIPFVALDR